MVRRYGFLPASFALLLGLASLAAAQSPPTPYALSERLGAEIDPEERAYFGLFPDVRGFEAARTETDADGAVRVVIDRGARPDSVLTMQRVTAEALGRFVETFEQHEAAFYNPSWQVVSSYVRPQATTAYVGRFNPVTVEVEGGRYVGHPFYVSDSLIVLESGSGASSFDWRGGAALSTTLTPVRAEDVRQITLQRGWIARFAPVLGGLAAAAFDATVGIPGVSAEGGAGRFLVAGGLGALATRTVVLNLTPSRPYDETLPELRDIAWFTPERYAPELPPVQAALDRKRPPPRTVRTYWISLGVDVTQRRTDEGTYGFSDSREGTDSLRSVQFGSPSTSMSVSVLARPISWLSLGATLHSSPDLSYPVANRQEVADTRRMFSFVALLDPVRVVWPQSRVGLGIGGGVIWGESGVAQRFPPVNFTEHMPDAYDLREQRLRPYFVADIEVLLPLDLALFGQFEAWSAPDVEVPLIEVQPATGGFPSGPPTLYRVDPHTVEFAQTGFVVGVRAGLWR